MNKFLILVALLLTLIFITTRCNGQSKSTYSIEWQGAGDSAQVFIWQGLDSTACPFVGGQDYKNPSIENYSVAKGITSSSYEIQLSNNGEFVVAAAIFYNSQGVYSPLGKSYAYKKSTQLAPPAMIKIRIIQ